MSGVRPPRALGPGGAAAQPVRGARGSDPVERSHVTNGRTSRPHAANQEDNYRRQSVPVAGGELAVGGWGGEGPLVVAAHGITVYALDGMRPAALPVPAVFLRAPRGMLDEPDAPLNPPGRAAKWLPGVPERDVPGVNHYTITLGPAGAAAVVAAVRGG